MSLAVISTGKNMDYWISSLKKEDPSLDIQVYPDIDRPDEVIGALLWKHPHGSLNHLKNLKWISSVGAGVDHVLSDPELPHVPVTRIVDKFLALDISRTAVMGVIGFEKKMPLYIRQKRKGFWRQHPPRRLNTIGVLGLGEMGSRITSDLVKLEYRVKGFSRTVKDLPGVESFYGKSVPDNFLEDLDVLINVLPLTSNTENILSIDLFRRMKQGAFIINLGRGAHLHEEDLLTSLREGHLGGAYLDVFRQEPLPENHPFWQEEDIVMTPHIASVTDAASAARLVIDNYKRVLNGMPLLHIVERDRGY